MIGNFMSYYTHLPHEATKGKMTFLLHGPCDKKAVVEGIGRTLGLPVASVDASSLIKDFPSDSVSQVRYGLRYTFTVNFCHFICLYLILL